MPVVTKYICDRCKNAQDKPEQMWNVNIHVVPHGSGYASSGAMHKALLCRKCCMEIGVLPARSEEEKKLVPPTPPTIEDMIREIVIDEIANQ